MNRIFRSRYILLPAALFLAGCYGRTVSNYDDVPELRNRMNAILEKSELSEEEQQKQQAALEALTKQKEEIYTINAGDSIAIVVYNHPDLSIKTIVTPDGNIGMVFVGQVKLSGLTLAQAAHVLEKELSKYIRNPKVGVSPHEIHSETCTIAGAVSKPGMYNVTNGMRLADLFAKAGGSAARLYDGVTLDAADFNNSIFIRHGKAVPVDFNKAISSGDHLHNVILRKGDYIYVAPRDESMVYLIGDVKQPKRQVWNKNLGLMELVAMGNWVNETYWHHVIIIRGGIAHPRLYKVDLDGILKGTKSNVLLEAGDIVYVPKDDISEYNVFVRKLLPTGQLLNMLTTPMTWGSQLGM